MYISPYAQKIVVVLKLGLIEWLISAKHPNKRVDLWSFIYVYRAALSIGIGLVFCKP